MDVKEMLKAGVHFGHKTSKWSPKMRVFIWGARNKVHLVDVSKTAFLLEKACEFLKNKAAEGGQFLFVGTKKPAQKCIEETAKSLSMPYVVNRWIGGALSNFDQVKKAVTRLLFLEEIMLKGVEQYTKKEGVVLAKELERLKKNVGGIVGLKHSPAALVVVDAKKEYSAVKEAAALGIPIVALVDTNTDPEGVTYIIPGNDDSKTSIEFITRCLSQSIADGKMIFAETQKDSNNLENKKIESVSNRVSSREDSQNDDPSNKQPYNKRKPFNQGKDSTDRRRPFNKFKKD